VRRRDFIALAGGVAAWPLAARAQQHDNRVRHIGVFMNLPEGDPDRTRWIAALLKSLDEFGWTEGRNIRFDFRGGIDAEHVQKNAEELVALNPDVIVAASAPAVRALRQATRTVPIIFVAVTDPVTLGLVESLARPGGNATGFSPAELGLGAKWLQVLKEMAPALTRVGVFHNPANAGSVSQFAIVQATAPQLGLALSVIDTADKSAIEQGVAAFASSPHGGLIRSSPRRLSFGCRRFIRCGSSPRAGGSPPMVPTSPRSTARLPAMSTASCGVKNRPIYRSRWRASTSWSSISRPQKRLGWPFRRRLLPPPTRSSNKRGGLTAQIVLR
jgi:hypothetical protein